MEPSETCCLSERCQSKATASGKQSWLEHLMLQLWLHDSVVGCPSPTASSPSRAWLSIWSQLAHELRCAWGATPANEQNPPPTPYPTHARQESLHTGKEKKMQSRAPEVNVAKFYPGMSLALAQKPDTTAKSRLLSYHLTYLQLI